MGSLDSLMPKHALEYTLKRRRRVSPPPSKCLPTGQGCGGAGKCCKGLICGTRVPGSMRHCMPPQLEYTLKKKPPSKCLPTGQECGGAGKCCKGLICGMRGPASMRHCIPPQLEYTLKRRRRVSPPPSKCLPTGQECGGAGKCCKG